MSRLPLFLLVVFLTSLSGIDPSGVTLTYWHQYDSPEARAALETVVQSFNAGNPYGIRVEATAFPGYGRLRRAMNQAIIRGGLPDLVAGYPDDALSYQLDDALVELTPYLTDPRWGLTPAALADLDPRLLDAWVDADGRRLGWATPASASVLIVNLGLLRELGFAGSPRTLSELHQMACASAAQGAGRGFPLVLNATLLETLVAGQGGNLWLGDRWDFTSEPVLTALNWVAELARAGCAYTPDEVYGGTQDFAQGLIPVALTSTAGLTTIVNQMAAAGPVVTDWALVPTPPQSAGAPPRLHLFTPGIMLVRSTPEAQLAAWLFLRHLTESEAGWAWARQMALFPVSRSAARDPAMFPAFAPLLELFRERDSWGELRSPRLSEGIVASLIAAGLADVVYGLDVRRVAERMTAEANQALADVD